MGKGLIWGLIWGWVVALLGLSAASLYLPLPDAVPTSASVEVPAASEFNKAKDDTEAMMPKDGDTAVETASPAPVTSNGDDAAASDETSSLDTQSAAVPEVTLDSPSDMPAPNANDNETFASGPVKLPSEEGDVPFLLGTSGAATEEPAPRLIQIDTATDDAPALNTEPAAPSIAIGVPVEPLVSQSQTPTAPVVEEAAAADPRALVRNAVKFENPDDKPLVSIILITPPDQTLAATLLDAFSFPVTFAVDPNDPQAAERAQTYHDAGFEVVFLANGIQTGATAQDVEVALEASIGMVPVAVGVLDTTEGVLNSSRDIQAQTAEKFSITGHGLISYEGGLNGSSREADKLDVKNTSVFRVLDAEGEAANLIKRYLSRAAFRAGQAGDVVVVGQTNANTLQAVIEWSLDERPDEIVLAPISAVLSLPR